MRWEFVRVYYKNKFNLRIIFSLTMYGSQKDPNKNQKTLGRRLLILI